MENLIILKSPERTFHYIGPEHTAGEWVNANMDSESHDYVLAESRLLQEIGKILRRIPRDKEDNVIKLMLMFRYFMYEMDVDFMPQYMNNMALLKQELEKLTKGDLK